MNEKPQEAPRDEQEDLLEQIITQGLDKMNAPGQGKEEAPGSETPPAPEQENSEKTASPAEKKNRRSSVYLYLLVLFGAAFLMLLLAYFVQQRNNAAVLDDLRSTTASREELLDKIRELESQVRFLQSVDDNWMSVYRELEEEYAWSVEGGQKLQEYYYAAQEELYSWKSFWELEQCYQAGDYESCAAIMILQSQSQYTYRTPDAAQERQNEIVQAVLDTGILDDRSQEHYDELLDAYLAEHSEYLLSVGC